MNLIKTAVLIIVVDIMIFISFLLMPITVPIAFVKSLRNRKSTCRGCEKQVDKKDMSADLCPECGVALKELLSVMGDDIYDFDFAGEELQPTWAVVKVNYDNLPNTRIDEVEIELVGSDEYGWSPVANIYGISYQIYNDGFAYGNGEPYVE